MYTSRLSKWSIRITYIFLIFFLFVVNSEPSVQNATERSKQQTGSDGHVKMCITWRVLHATPVSDSSRPGKSLHWAGINCYVCDTTRPLLKETRIKVRAFFSWKIWCLRVNFSHWHLKKSFDMYMYFSFKFLKKIKSIKVSSVLQLSIIEF